MRDAAIDHARQSGRNGSTSRSAGAPSLDGTVDPRPAGQKPRSGRVRVGGAMTSAAVAAQRLGGRRGGGAEPGLLVRLRGRLPRIRPLKALTVAAFSTALVGILANAMVFQRGHRPAPLFGFGQSVDGTPDGDRQASPVQRADAAPPPTPAAVERTGTIPPVPAPAPAASPASALAAPVAAPPKPTHRATAKPKSAEGAAGLPRSGAAEAHPRPGHAAAKPAKVPETASAEPGTKEPKRVAEKPGADHKAATVPAHPRPHLAKADAPSTPDAPPAKKTVRTP